MLKAHTIEQLVEKTKGKEWKYLFFAFPKGEKRSILQNKYYWGVIIKVLSEHTGYEKDDLHGYLTKRFLGVTYIDLEAGQVTEVTKSTSRLNKQDFMNYCERIRIWAHESLGLKIPDPEGLTIEQQILIEAQN